MKDTHSSDRRKRATDILAHHGYGKMKSVADKEVRRGIGEHEKAEHSSKKTKLKLKDGGKAEGKEPKSRLDRKPRAAGGRNKGHKEPRVSVNVINAGGKQPMPMGAAPSAPMPPPAARPPMAPPAGAPPPQMGAGMPARPMPGMMPQQQRPFKGGGPVRSKGEHPHLEGGAGGGLGRLEKAAAQKKRK